MSAPGSPHLAETDRSQPRAPSRTPRWLLLLLAVSIAVAVGEGAGILARSGGTATVPAIWAGFIAFGSTLVLVLTVIGFLDSQR